MILDFTLRFETNPGAPLDIETEDAMVLLYKSFMSDSSEEHRRAAVMLALSFLGMVGPRKEYTAKTFATIKR